MNASTSDGGAPIQVHVRVPYLRLEHTGAVLEENAWFRRQFATGDGRGLPDLFPTREEYRAWLAWITDRPHGTLDCRLLHPQKGISWWTTVFWQDPAEPSQIHCLFFPSELGDGNPTVSQHMVMGAPTGMVLTTRTGEIVWLNPAAAELFHESREQLTGQTLQAWIAPVSAPGWEEVVQHLDETGAWHGDVWVGPEGSRDRRCRMSCTLYPDPMSPVCWLVWLEDLQPLVHLQREMELRETFFRSLAEESLAGVFLLSPEGRVEYANPVLHHMFGYRPGELQGKDALDLVDPEDVPEVQQTVRSHLRQGKPIHLHFRGKHREGRPLTLEFLARPIVVHHQTYLLGTVLDRTAEVQMEEQLTLLQRMEAISRLVSGIAHDFRNAMTLVLVTLENLKEKTRSLPEALSLKQELDTLEREAHHVVRMADRFARLGRPSVEPEWVVLNDHIRANLTFYRRALGEDIRLEFFPGDHLPPIWIPPADLEQMLHNLLINARDAMPAGGQVTIRTSVTMQRHPLRDPASEPIKSYVCLEVQDTGHGIPPELIPRIFEPYFTTKGTRGTGLGLYVVYQMITRLGGWVDVDSSPGKGTTFRLYFPVLSPEEVSPIQEELQSETRTLERLSPRLSLTLLFVEDREDVARSYTQYLEQRGYRVFHASTLEQARRRLRTLGRALQGLITDLVLPDGNAMELVEEARSQYPHMPVLVMSGYSVDAEQLQRMETLQVLFRQKPLTPRELEDILREWAQSLQKNEP